jgi:two-component system, NarL family, sensor histidine kinase DesK
MRPLVDESVIFGRPPALRARARVGVLLGLLFLVGPLSDLLEGAYAAAHLVALLAGLALFIALYASLLPPAAWLRRLGPRGPAVALALLPLIAVVLLAGGAPTSFVALFVYFAAAAGILLPAPVALGAIAVTAAGVAVAGLVSDEDAGALTATVLTIVSIGVLMTTFGRITRTNRELESTREELARLAVSDERLRFARDLHDLLGHSLSVIALKSELAAKILDTDPKRAAAELDDIQSVTRAALTEVRETVHGYRGLPLSDAVSGARDALTAAGIELELADTHAELPADVDSVFAWAVREGTTNVIRHSDAHSCVIRIHVDDGIAAVEIENDGTATPTPTRGGSGLVGLRERAERVHGAVEAGARPEGGFRLALTVPLAEP